MITYRKFQFIKDCITKEHTCIFEDKEFTIDPVRNSDLGVIPNLTAEVERTDIDRPITEEILTAYRDEYLLSLESDLQNPPFMQKPLSENFMTEKELQDGFQKYKEKLTGLSTPPGTLPAPKQVERIDSVALYRDIELLRLLRYLSVTSFKIPKQLWCCECQRQELFEGNVFCENCEKEKVMYLKEYLDKLTAAWTIATIIKKEYPDLKVLHEKLWCPGGIISFKTWESIDKHYNQ